MTILKTFLSLLQLLMITKESFEISNEMLKVSVYYESLCPYSIDFIINQLYPGYQVIGSSLTLELVPYGNTKRTKVDGHWKYRCQHGEDECRLNRLQACGMSKTTSQSKQLDYVACVETAAQDGSRDLPKCGKTVGMDEEIILECFNGEEGTKLIDEYANKTNSLTPAHTYVPWITFNDKFNRSTRNAATRDFVRTACSLFEERPQGCPHLLPKDELLYLSF